MSREYDPSKSNVSRANNAQPSASFAAPDDELDDEDWEDDDEDWEDYREDSFWRRALYCSLGVCLQAIKIFAIASYVIMLRCVAPVALITFIVACGSKIPMSAPIVGLFAVCVLAWAFEIAGRIFRKSDPAMERRCVWCALAVSGASVAAGLIFAICVALR